MLSFLSPALWPWLHLNKLPCSLPKESLSIHISSTCERPRPDSARPPGRGALGCPGTTTPGQRGDQQSDKITGLPRPTQLSRCLLSVHSAQPFITLTKQTLTKNEAVPSILLNGSLPSSLCPLSTSPGTTRIPGQSLWLPGLGQAPGNPGVG